MQHKTKGAVMKLFTISKKGGNNGKLWNGNHPKEFFNFIHENGITKIWDVRRTPNGQYGCFFDTNIMQWCCDHDNIKFEWKLEFAPEKELFSACNEENWDLLTYAKAYFTPQIIRALNNVKIQELALDGVAILCAEQELFNCHRVLIAEYLKMRFPQIKIEHLGLAYDRYGNEKGAVPNQIMIGTRQYIENLVKNS
jgi:hypothetical protein